jgi:tRNA A37 threonylcarbamoyladenosine dehydratase
VPQFYNAETSDELLRGELDFVVDAIDNVTAKVHLIATCLRRGIPLVSSMGAAARLDPTRIRTADLSETHTDPFARHVRKVLRQQHGIDAREGSPVGVSAVFSDEEPIAPTDVGYDKGEGFRCVCPNGDNGLHSCDKRSRIEGSASFVTGAFGLACASVVVRALIKP